MRTDINKEFTFCHHFFFGHCNFFLKSPASQTKKLTNPKICQPA
ncbi:MAG: hypothetical protein AVDCRST_MAG74-14 [uncultured Pyrinomonadaceae bacterium]|uniref:Uncharacterized protein n=1 Tax=uncultured Pyrinomonadaceae bacterium TaxID=2283094 RepID=A0A6J4N4R1_9BACT|nr:MAG: hypothetical protein AVDCRST_MAG74-14 [uncultured Pyrinomonadaceae bacterium]